MSEVEHVVKILVLDETFQAELKKLEDEGFELIPGVRPIAVYNLVRAKQKPVAGQGGFGDIRVDDSKVMILRANGTLESV